MASYRIVIKRSAAKEIEKIPRRDRQRIVDKILSLASDPTPPDSKKLSGQERYRLRQGNYRILYTLEDEKLIITVVKVAHRKNVYKN